MAREARRITLGPDEHDRLTKIANARLAPQGLAFRARIILRCAQPDKPTNLQVADELACDPDTVACWRNRFARHRLQGLRDLPRSGRPPAFSPPGAPPGPGPGHDRTGRRGRAGLPLVLR